ncbi:MAG: DNA primase, partial [Alphaproteobacteria bacterium]|nr:DNA primase [Alphaproteobacteria bacterium]
DTAASWFESQLRSSEGASARAYVDKRGLSEATVKKFRLGLAPDHRTLIKEALGARGFTEEQMIETGLLIKPEEGEAYARFRDRLIFPISDGQGRIVGFGGRALGEARAKYLNSPETPLFHKGRLLYNLRNARAKARDADRLIVVEGYMDVIALAQAGFEESVAPLGTAVTEEQIELLWRITPEPVLCFDGDQAGERAAERAALRALPGLKPGQSLRFALLPQGEDPDSLIANQGRGAMRKVLDEAQTLIDLLWEIELNRQPADTPERRAGLRSRLFELCGPIGDETVRRFYRDEFLRRFDEKFARPAQSPGDRSRARTRQGGFGDFRPSVSQELKRTMLAQSAVPASAGRDRLILKTLLAHPLLLDEMEEEIAALDLQEA